MKNFKFDMETDPNDQYDTGDMFERIAEATRPIEIAKDIELEKTIKTLDRSIDQLIKLRDSFKSNP